MVPASVRDRLSLMREEKLRCKICLYSHLEQGGMHLVERWCWSLFSFLQMGANNSSLTPLNCILQNWDRFNPQSLKKTLLIFLCDTAWLRYPLEDGNGGQLEDLLIIILFYNQSSSVENKGNGQKQHTCCPFSLCETCQIYVLRVQIWI